MRKLLPWAFCFMAVFGCEVPAPIGVTEYDIKYEVESAGHYAYIEYAHNHYGVRTIEERTNATLPWIHEMMIYDDVNPDFGLYVYTKPNDGNARIITARIYIDDSLVDECSDLVSATVTAELP